MKKPTKEAIKFYKALKNKHIIGTLEHPSDGHKHIDLRPRDAKIDIEIDGDEHYTNPKKIRSDIKRRYWSSQEGYVTIHIPNHIINNRIDEVLKAIYQVAITRKKKLEKL